MIFLGAEEKRGLSEDNLGSGDIKAACSLVRRVRLLAWNNLLCLDKSDGGGYLCAQNEGV